MPDGSSSYSNRHYGWNRDPPDSRDHFFVPELSADDYPESVDLRDNCPEVYDQGHIGSCTANTAAAAFEFELNKQGLEDFMPSRLFIYYNEREMVDEVDFDRGGHNRNAMKSIHVKGVCREDDWPYDGTRANHDKSWPEGALAGQQPPEDCYLDALQNRATKYQRLQRDIGDMKDCLVQGYPIVAGFNVYDSFHDDDVRETGIVSLPGPDEEQTGGHAILIVGYDDRRGNDDSEGSFLVRNSWGADWGDEGYCWMPYEYFADPDLSHDFWTLRVVTADGEDV